jgi:hypothetical protein
MIDEYAKKGEAAKKIQPQVALDDRRLARDAHRTNSSEAPCTTIAELSHSIEWATSASDNEVSQSYCRF